MNYKVCSDCGGSELILRFTISKENYTSYGHIKIGFICKRCKTIRLIDDYKNYKIIKD